MIKQLEIASKKKNVSEDHSFLLANKHQKVWQIPSTTLFVTAHIPNHFTAWF
jgi:hypothetical protein